MRSPARNLHGMLTKLLRHGLVYGITGLLSRGIQIVLIPVYTRVLVPEEYGMMDYMLAFAALVNLTVALEISQGVARRLADAGTAEEKRAYASTAAWFALAAYSFFAVVALLFSIPLTLFLLDNPAHAPVFRIAVIAIAANGVFCLLQDLLRWQLKPGGYAAASVAFTVATTAVGVYLVVVPRLGVAGIFYGQLAGALVGILASWLMWRELYDLQFVWEKCRDMLRYSLPLVVSGIAVFANLYIDRIAIKELLGLSELGVYGIGYRFASVVSLLVVGFQSALTPLIFQSHGLDTTPAQLARVFRYFTAMALSLVLLIGLFARELLWILATEQYYGAWDLMPVLAAGILFGNLYIFAPGLFLANKTRHVAGINIAAALLNLGLNLVLIPILGLIGAALATATASFAACCLYMMFSQRLYPVPHEWRRIAGGGLVSGMIVLGAAQVSTHEVVSLGQVVLKIPVFLGATAAITWLLLGKAEIAAAFALLLRRRASADRN